jgi:peptidoglycan/xylan/chitin deacetylase (PgdA/CDA1 family)
MSWDDGHTLDLRLAELLEKYHFAATFYVPARFPAGIGCLPDGFPTLSVSQLRQISAGFELGSHTLDHRDITSLTRDEALRQVVGGRQSLEDTLGRSVHGFSYPAGMTSPAAREIVQSAGILFARTTEPLYTSGRFDPLMMPVSFQFYPHRRTDLVRAFLKGDRWGQRWVALRAVLDNGSFDGMLRRALDGVCAGGGVFHLWGHSWELELTDQWRALEEFLKYAADRVPRSDRLTNGQVWLLAGATDARRARQLVQARVGG